MNFFIYLAQLSLYALVMWGIYFFVWRNRPLHAYSRAYLLASLLLPLILPLIRVPVSTRPSGAAFRIDLAPLSNGAAAVSVSGAGISWAGLMGWIYAGLCLTLASLYAMAHVRIYLQLRKGTCRQYDDHSILTNTGIGPGTIGRRIFFPRAEIDAVILAHERAHIRLGHRFDSLLLQVIHIIFWISPAHWLIGRELKAVHEFEADGLACQDMAAEEYAKLLLSQSLGSSRQLLIAQTFFRNPLKRRIMMLQKVGKPKRVRLVFATALLTAGFVSTVVLAQTKQSVKQISEAELKTAIAMLDDEVIRRNTPARSGEILLLGGGGVVFKTVDQMPAFNGNLREWLLANMRFPDAAEASRVTKSSKVQFTVDEQGQIHRPVLIESSGNKSLDAEAIRVIGAMPNWKPGRLNGQAAAVLTTLYISYNRLGDGC